MSCSLHGTKAPSESSLAKRELESPVPELVASASGIILELGPGSGTQVLRYNPKKVTRIYGVEPNVDLHDRLRARVKEAGLSDIYTIIPCGIDDVEELKKYDIKGESFDTILIIQVLCGVASPKEAVASAYRLLKPGGEMIVYEHGLNKVDLISRIVQSELSIVAQISTDFWRSLTLGRYVQYYLASRVGWLSPYARCWKNTCWEFCVVKGRSSPADGCRCMDIVA